MFNKFILGLVPESKKHILYSVLANVLALLTNISLIGLFVYSLFAVITKNMSFNVYYALIIGIGLILIRYFLVRTSSRQAYLATGDVKSQIREKLLRKNINLKKNGKKKFKTAEITQLALEGAEQTELYTSVFLPQFFYSLSSVLIVFIVIAFISLKTAIILLLCIPLIPLSVLAIVRFAKKLFFKYWGDYTDLGSDFLDNVQGMTTLKIYNADQYMGKKVSKSADRFRKITMKVLSMQLNSITVMDIIAYGGAAVAIILALRQMLVGDLNIYQALFVALISAEFFLPLRALGSAFHVAMNGISAANKIEDFLMTPEESLSGKEAIITDCFSFENLSFGFDSDKLLFEKFNLQINKGEFVSLVGDSGSGKSTVAVFFTGRQKPLSGQVLIDDVSVNELDFFKLNTTIRLVSYDSRIFKGTIRSNLLLAKVDASEEELLSALHKSCLLEFVQTNGGLDLEIEEGGTNLSGGQRQRLAIARIFLTKAGLYIFDEALSNVDIDNEAKIIENIKQLTEEAAVLFITHRLASARDSDRIYLLKAGQAEIGTHQGLMSDKLSSYYQMYTIQKSKLSLENGGKI